MERRFREIDLFDTERELGRSCHELFQELITELSAYGQKIAIEKGFGGYAVSVRRNETKAEVNYPLEFNDIPYPFDETNGLDRMVTSTIAVLNEKNERSRFSGCVEIRLRGRWWACGVTFPPSAVRKDVTHKNKEGVQEKIGENICIPLTDDEARTFLEELIRCRLDNYESSFPPFGCCHLYQACSESGKCLQKSRSYSGACQYKRNLDSGKVFYGKNKSRGVES